MKYRKLWACVSRKRTSQHVALTPEKRVPQNHILRKIHGTIDFEFIYGEVKHTSGDNGNVSVPPPEMREGTGVNK